MSTDRSSLTLLEFIQECWSALSDQPIPEYQKRIVQAIDNGQRLQVIIPRYTFKRELASAWSVYIGSIKDE